MNKQEACRLCGGKVGPSWVSSDKAKTRYFQCETCDYVQMEEAFLPSSAQEKSRYETHKNSDSTYEKYLSKILDESSLGLKPKEAILDFGSGPFPMAEKILSQRGLSIQSYDPYFQPKSPAGLFDVILLHEVVEHFTYPLQTFAAIRLLTANEGRWLIHTQFFPGFQNFQNWSYRRDFTHVGFYNWKSLSTLAEKYGMRIAKIQGSDFIQLAFVTEGKA